ncbi:MAG: PEP-CTERM sorting domain-containing protein [Pirellulaceae bacterium]|nr:PEP-CTERM sorting domain-containing protein [Pirellulaceae bacterium]
MRSIRKVQLDRLVFVQTVLCCVFCTSWTFLANGAITDGLVAYYPFDDGAGLTLTEVTGLSSDGELYEFPDDDSQWVAGQIGGALEYDGIDDFVIAAEHPLAETALSVSIWGYANEAPTWASLVKNWGQGSVGQFHFGLGVGDADTLNIFITTESGAANVGTDVDDIEFEEWQHFAFVVDPIEETVFLYRNGEVVDDQLYDGTEFTDAPNSEALGIGVKTNNFGDAADPGGCCPGYWDGRLDDLGIWHRALTSEEVSKIYQDGLLGKPLLPGAGIRGDFNGDGQLDAMDIDLLSAEVRFGNNPASFDLTADGRVDSKDRIEWVEVVANTYFGDSNLDGEFNSSDFVAVFAAGEYEDNVDDNSSWSTGDWNGDTEFDSSDFVTAFTAGGYEVGARVFAVPEPSSLIILLIGLVGLACRLRR